MTAVLKPTIRRYTSKTAFGLALGAGALALTTWWWVGRRPVPQQWVSTAIVGRDMVEGTRVQLNFTDGLLEVHGGCNWRSGSYYQVEDVFYWCDKEGTSIGCRPDLAVQDYWLASWLASGVRIRKNSHQLVMQGSGVEVSFRPLGLDSIL